VRDLVYRRLLAQAFVLGWRTVEAGAGGVTWVAPEVCDGSRDARERVRTLR
jgi:hypothetical protein